MVVYRLQALQVRRKHIREAAEKVREAVDEILTLATRFHTTAFDPSMQMEIIAALTQIEKRYELFPKMAAGKSECSMDAVDPAKVSISPSFIFNLRVAITSNHFDEASAPLSPRDPQIADIQSAAHDLTAELDRVIVAALD